MVSLVQQFPALQRPLRLKVVAELNQGADGVSPEELLSLSIRVPQIQQSLAGTIRGFGAERITSVMVSASDQNVRRQAAAYLAGMAQQGDQEVASAVIAAVKFDRQATEVAWKGGPLFVPGIAWKKEVARALVGQLIRWHVWCDRHAKKPELLQLHNNLRSLSLARAAGYQSPGWQQADTPRWLTAWGKVVGRAGLEKILKEQGVADNARYAAVLKKL